MCGRFTLSSGKKDEEKFGIEIKPSFNIAPSTNVLVLDKNLKPAKMKWNYSPTWAKQPLNIINARSETLYEKPSFKNTERCIFITDGYYEWMRTNNSKTPYFHYFERDLMYFGGLYNSSSGCCIVTRESYKNISFIHHRQPVLLEEHDFDSWISKDHRYTSPVTDQIKFHKVSIRVNSPNNNDAENLVEIK